MTELEIMRHAKDYLDRLAKGIDPLTGREIPEGETVRSARISRCLSYVSDVLRQVIESGGIRAVPGGKAPFSLSAEERGRYVFPDRPLSVSQIAQRLNELAPADTMQKLKAVSITKYLLQSGLLSEEVSPDGSRSKRPTEAGARLGITTELRQGYNGPYIAVLYGQEAQQFILDGLDAVAAINAAPLHENQGKPWSPDEDAYLRRSAAADTDIREMSGALGRPRAEIRARRKSLGLTQEVTEA